MEASTEPRLASLQRVEERFVSKHGHELCSHRWVPAPGSATQPPAPVAGLLLSHGYSNYIGAFFDWKASIFSSYGFQVFAVDPYSHGKSDGLPCHITDFTVLVDDVEDYAKEIKGRHLAHGVPLFIYGESMGGAVALQAARRDAQLFAGLILMAPMAGFDASEMPHPLVQLAGRAVAYLAPWAPITPMKRDIQAFCFRDPQRLEEIGLDPHRYAGKVRIGTALQFKDTTVEIQAALHEIRTPFLLLHGTADVITSPSVSKALFAASESRDKTLLLFENGWHVLWFETHATRKALLQEIVRWVHQRSPAAVAAGLAQSPQLPLSLMETRPDLPGPFRIPGDPLLPWTYKSHGRAGCPVVEAGAAAAGVSAGASEAAAVETADGTAAAEAEEATASEVGE